MQSVSKIKRISFRGFWIAVGILLGSLPLTSCLNNLESPDLPPAAYVSIYQGSTDAPEIDVFANQNRINQNPLTYSQVLPYGAFFPGNRDFRFSAINSATALLEKVFVLKADTLYSVFVANKTEGIDAFIVKDTWEEPTPEKAQLRFVHLSSDTAPINLEISGSTAPLVTTSNFKTASGFKELPKGNVILTVKSSVSNQTLIQTGTLDLKGNRVYTLILRGLSSETSGSKKLDLQLVTNYIGN